MPGKFKNYLLDVRTRFLLILSFSISAIFTTDIPFIIFIYFASLFVTKIIGGDILFPYRKYRILIPFFLGLTLLHVIFSRTGVPILEFHDHIILYYDGFIRIILAIITMLIILTTPTILMNIPDRIVLKSLAAMKLPHSLLIPILTAYRFLPIIREKAKEKLHILKLKNTENLNRQTLFFNLKINFELLQPLIIESLMTAKKLATVLDLRGFRKSRSAYYPEIERLKLIDHAVIFMIFIFIVNFILLKKQII